MLDRRKWQTPGGRHETAIPADRDHRGGGACTCSSGAAAAATPSHVVPPNGKVGGKGYCYYLERGWEVFFASPGPCQTVSVGGLRVAVVDPSDGPDLHRAGRPVISSPDPAPSAPNPR